ncbi:MAG: hypothetical protein K2L17_11400 [Muribaculaceae bacterium]|nr:hypothetical protein [Muribaculaceae bacterium]
MAYLIVTSHYNLIVAAEYRYLTDCGKGAPYMTTTGDVGFLRIWFEGKSGKATKQHLTVFQNPLNGIS